MLRLRKIEPSDLPFLYQWENDATMWADSDTHNPLSRHDLHQYIENTTGDIYRDGQLRLIIEDSQLSYTSSASDRSSESEIRTLNFQYGVLLDMVGDPSATFPREYFSMQYAGGYVEQLWRTAQRLGYGRYFVQQVTYYPITDDHFYVSTIAGIPCVDIIDYKTNTETGFAEWWHTQHDDIQNINKQTLQAVGETVLTTICSK